MLTSKLIINGAEYPCADFEELFDKCMECDGGDEVELCLVDETGKEDQDSVRICFTMEEV